LTVARYDPHQSHNSDKSGFDRAETDSKIEIADLLKWCNSRSVPISRYQAVSQNYKHTRDSEFYCRSILYESNIKGSFGLRSNCPDADCLRTQARQQSNQKFFSVDQVGKIGDFLIHSTGNSWSELDPLTINPSA
jgi:hypothetical protein